MSPCSASARRRCDPPRSRRKRSSRCFAISSTRISTLILDNQNRTANHAVTRLSDFLRYTLDQDPMKKVTLRQEIEALDLYITTEKLRFNERLRLEFAIE